MEIRRRETAATAETWSGEGAGKISFGIYACSPEDSSFQAVFDHMELTDCKWLAHDGQAPDKE